MSESAEQSSSISSFPQNHCFGCGPANPDGLRLHFQPAAAGGVVCLATIPAKFQGPPAYVHGGIIATMLDEAMSKAVRAAGHTSMTASLEIDYHRPVHSGAPIRIEGRLLVSEGRKHRTEASILDSRGHLLASAKGLFVEVKPHRLISGNGSIQQTQKTIAPKGSSSQEGLSGADENV